MAKNDSAAALSKQDPTLPIDCRIPSFSWHSLVNTPDAVPPKDTFLSWGWRIPFLISLVLVAVALYIRLKVMETPAFQALKESGEQVRVPIWNVLRYHPKKVLLALCFGLSADVQGYVVFTWSVTFISNLGMPDAIGTLAVAIAAFLAIFSYPLLGSLSDRIGRRPIIAAGAVLSVLFAFPYFWLLDTKSVPLVILAFIIMFSVSNVAHNASKGALLPELFPTRIRYTGISLSYHATGIIGGGPAPMIATSLTILSDGSPWPVALYLERVSVGLLESFEADEGGGQREEGCEGVGAAFVAQRQAAVAGEPGHGAFDDPPVAAEALLGLDILACQPRPDSPVS